MPQSNVGQCWECSQRRLVCDLTKPACRKCQSRGKECPGYDHKPLKWMQPGQTRSKGARSGARLRTAASATTARGKGSAGRSFESGGTVLPGTVVPIRSQSSSSSSGSNCNNSSPEQERTSPQRSANSVVRSRVEQAGIVPRPVRDTSDFGRMLQAIEYYNVFVAPDMVGSGTGGVGNPYYIPLWYAEWIPPTTCNIIICTSIGHRMLRSYAGHEESRQELSVMLRSHRGEAIRNLALELSQSRLETFISVFGMLLTEIQHSISPDWWQHIDGAYTIINMYGGMGYSIKSRPLLRHLHHTFSCLDILSSTTAPAVDPERAQRQLELIEHLDDLCSESALTPIPCSPRLLTEIIYINHCRSLQKWPKTPHTVHADHRGKSVPSDILKRIMDWSSEAWASHMSESTAAKYKNAVGEARPPTCPDRWDWARIGRIYQSSAALYCMSSLPESMAGYSSPVDLKEAFRKGLLEDLQENTADPIGHMRKLVLWPLSIIGLVLDADDEKAQRYVRSELEWYSRELGTTSPLVAKKLLERVWASGIGDRGGRWEYLFDRPYIFAL